MTFRQMVNTRAAGSASYAAQLFLVAAVAAVGMGGLGESLRADIAGPSVGMGVVDVGGFGHAAEYEGEREAMSGSHRVQVGSGSGSLVCEAEVCRFERGLPAFGALVRKVAPVWIGYGAGAVAGRLAWSGPLGIAAGVAAVAAGYVASKFAGEHSWTRTAVLYGTGVVAGGFVGAALAGHFAHHTLAGQLVGVAAMSTWTTPASVTVAAAYKATWKDPEGKVAAQLVNGHDHRGLARLTRAGEGDLESRLRSAAATELRGDIVQLRSEMRRLGHAEAEEFVIGILDSTRAQTN